MAAPVDGGRRKCPDEPGTPSVRTRGRGGPCEVDHEASEAKGKLLEPRFTFRQLLFLMDDWLTASYGAGAAEEVVLRFAGVERVHRAEDAADGDGLFPLRPALEALVGDAGEAAAGGGTGAPGAGGRGRGGPRKIRADHAGVDEGAVAGEGPNQIRRRVHSGAEMAEGGAEPLAQGRVPLRVLGQRAVEGGDPRLSAEVLPGERGRVPEPGVGLLLVRKRAHVVDSLLAVRADEHVRRGGRARGGRRRPVVHQHDRHRLPGEGHRGGSDLHIVAWKPVGLVEDVRRLGLEGVSAAGPGDDAGSGRGSGEIDHVVREDRRVRGTYIGGGLAQQQRSLDPLDVAREEGVALAVALRVETCGEGRNTDLDRRK